MKKNSLMLLLLTFCVKIFSLEVDRMQVNYLDNPFGIDKTPHFSWAALTQERGGIQVAYEIVVIDGSDNEVWSTGRVNSPLSYQIKYGGSELKSKSAYRWKLRIWDQNENCSDWSRWHTFETAMLSPEDWEAQWVEENPDARISKAEITFDSPVTTRYVRLDVQKLGLPAAGEGYYRLQLSEIEILDANGTNIAIAKPVTMNTVETIGTSWRASNLTDGYIKGSSYTGATSGVYWGGPSVTDCYVEIDLGQDMEVSSVILYPRANTPAEADKTKSCNFPSSYTISVKKSTDSQYTVKYQKVDGEAPSYMGNNSNLCAFGKAIDIKGPVAKARMYTSGAGNFELRINGQCVTDNVLEPGESFFPKTVLYATYDVTSLLHEGKNGVIALVGGAQYHNPGLGRYQKLTNNYGTIRFIGQLEVEYKDGTTETFNTDDSWKCAFETPITFCSWYGGEDFDATSPAVNMFSDPNIIDTWPNAMSCKDSIGVLKAQFYQPTKVVETWEASSVTDLGNGEYVVDFGQNFAGQYEFTLKGEKGQKIELWSAELVDEKGAIIQINSDMGSPIYDCYTFAGDSEGETWGPRLVYHGFRYLQIKGLKTAPAAKDFTAKRIRLGVEQSGNFTCSNTLLNDVHTLIHRAIQSNLYNSVTDCPHREKLGWLEVPQLLFNSLAYNFDLAAYFPKISMDTRDSQFTDGSAQDGFVCNVAPYFYRLLDDYWGKDPSWSGSTILVPYRSYIYYGDKSTLEEQYATMKRLMKYYLTRREGFLLNINTLGDWGAYDSRTSVKFTINCTYYALTKAMVEIATVLENKGDVQYYSYLANKIREELNSNFYSKNGYYDANTQAANAMALYYGIVEEENKDKVVQSLVKSVEDANYHLTTGEVASKPLFISLAENGYNDIVYKMATAEDMPSYGYFLTQGATTLPEFWDMNGSQNHCMQGHIDEWFFSHLGGIQNSGIAHDCITIAPYFAPDLTYVNADITSVRGKVKADWERKDENTIVLNVTVPFNSRAALRIPQSYTITENGKEAADIAGVSKVETDDKNTTLCIGAGTYTFMLNGTASAIKNVNADTVASNQVYDILGRLINDKGQLPVPPGVYIMDNEKYIVK